MWITGAGRRGRGLLGVVGLGGGAKLFHMEEPEVSSELVMGVAIFSPGWSSVQWVAPCLPVLLDLWVS